MGNSKKKTSPRGVAITTALFAAGAMGMSARGMTFHITGNFNNSGTITGGAADTYIFSGGVFTNAGTFTNAGALQSSDVINNSGTFTQTGSSSQTANFTNSGNATFSGTQSWSSGMVYKNSAGTTAFNTDVGSVSVSNLTLNISGGGVTMASNQHFAQLTNNATLSFQSGGNITLSGPIGGNGTLAQTGNGTTTLNGNYTATGPVNISAGKLVFATTANARQDTGVLLKMSNLSIASTSVLDVTNHDLIIGNSNLQTINDEILNGFGAGPGGASITSSTSVSSSLTFLIPIDAAALGVSSWDNVPVTNPNSIIVKYTTFGDATLDGLVNSDDFGVVISNLGTTTAGSANIEQSWIHGDVNVDGLVNADDFGVIISNLGSARLVMSSSISIPSNVPEPASLLILSLGAVVLTRKNRHHF